VKQEFSYRQIAKSLIEVAIIQAARENAGLSIEDAARLSGMELTEWMAIEDGSVPREVNQLRAMAETMQVNFDRMASWVLVFRDAWEL
jgi:transcriptional regulator with XRE-family HTH domain